MAVDSSSSLVETRSGPPQRGGACAKEEWLTAAYERLRRLASRILGEYPGVRRWEQTDDVWQIAALRLCRALRQTEPESPLHFYRLAALQIRRTLIDLVRSLHGPNGWAANHDTNHGRDVFRRRGRARFVDETHDPVSLADWAEFHEAIGRLPDTQREMFDLLWYGGLSQAEAAELLEIDVRSVKRRWRAARLLLQRRRAGEPPR